MDLINMITTIDVTDAELAAQVRGISAACRGRDSIVVWALHGFDEDPRELWEIPEAVAHARRLVDYGVIALLHPSTRRPELGAASLPGDCPALGGFELWCLGTGRLEGVSGGQLLLSAAMGRELIRRFLGDETQAAVERLATNLDRFPAARPDPRLLIAIDPRTGEILPGAER